MATLIDFCEQIPYFVTSSSLSLLVSTLPDHLLGVTVLLSLTFLLNSVTSSMPPASAQPLIGKTHNALPQRNKTQKNNPIQPTLFRPPIPTPPYSSKFHFDPFSLHTHKKQPYNQISLQPSRMDACIHCIANQCYLAVEEAMQLSSIPVPHFFFSFSFHHRVIDCSSQQSQREMCAQRRVHTIAYNASLYTYRTNVLIQRLLLLDCRGKQIARKLAD